ncbi:MAG TPA: hypothetical protein VLI67_09360, partial [Vicinamibacteria bacterium]|nr:hypothetical protein [Vicinamibacteria bacterium]
MRLFVLVALSGAAGLVYQSLWMRSFGLVFGNTTDAVAFVLSAFMGGLALGGFLVARRPAPRPLEAYARVEIGIAATALVSWPLLRALPAAYGALAGRISLDGPLESLGRGLAAGVLVMPTAVLLGATVPLVVAHLTRSGRGFHRVLGRLYLVNTLGGAAGVALGPFVLVPALGLSGTLLAAAGLNAVIGGVALRLSRDVERVAGPGTRPAGGRAPGPPIPALFPALAFASGAFSFAVEVLWTRSLVLVIGSSVYSFHLVLLAVLLGIASGTAVYERLRPRVARPRLWLGSLLATTGLLSLAGVFVLGWLPEAFLALVRALPVSFAAHQAAGFALSLAALLPVTLVLGLTFPLLAHLLASETDAQRASGLLYGWNTAGAIVGAV